MSPLLSFRGSGRRSASPRETRDSSYVDSAYSTDSDDSHHADMSNHTSSRPLTVSIPHTFKAQGAYCPRRPNLAEILLNEAAPPWTLSAFMAYLSHNHCLETLEFTMDAKRYRQHYEKVASRSPGGQIAPGSDQANHMNSLWQRLMQAYIQPSGLREVNLPSDVRDGLLTQNLSLVPPHPDTLNVAIRKVHELMEESVLVPFLNSVYPQTALPDSNSSSVEDLTSSTSYDDRGLFRSRTTRKAGRKGSPLSGSPPLPHSSTASPPVMPPHPHHLSAPSAISQFARTISQSARQGLSMSHSHHGSPQSPSRPVSAIHNGTSTSSPHHISSVSSEPLNSLSDNRFPSPSTSLTPDDVSLPSLQGEPMTPPTTPPTNDIGGSPLSASAIGRNGNPWKRMRYSFGWRKKGEDES